MLIYQYGDSKYKVEEVAEMSRHDDAIAKPTRADEIRTNHDSSRVNALEFMYTTSTGILWPKPPW
jgi:hypothetical protein